MMKSWGQAMQMAFLEQRRIRLDFFRTSDIRKQESDK